MSADSLDLDRPAAGVLPATGAAVADPARAPGRTRGKVADSLLHYWLPLTVVWTLAGLLSASQVYFFYTLKMPMSWTAVLIFQMPPWLIWIPCTPLIVRLARRFRFERGTAGRAIVVHLVGASVCTTIMFAVAAWSGKMAGEVWYLEESYLQIMTKLWAKNVHMEFAIYGIVVATTWALDYEKRWRDQALSAAKLETKLVEAQLDALRMQLHPHFLFNTLHAIGVLVRKGDQQGSIRMLSGVSDLLRIALQSGGKQTVTLKEELDFLDRYLEVEKTRFADRLAVKTSIQPDTLGAVFPNFLLQPIVENAIRHGIESRAQGGTVEITTLRDGDTLRIVVRDDGPGLGRGKNGGTGTGLKNICARLDQMYPKAHSFVMEEAPGGGVRVTIEIPFRSAGDP